MSTVVKVVTDLINTTTEHLYDPITMVGKSKHKRSTNKIFMYIHFRLLTIIVSDENSNYQCITIAYKVQLSY